MYNFKLVFSLFIRLETVYYFNEAETSLLFYNNNNYYCYYNLTIYECDLYLKTNNLSIKKYTYSITR